jgi:hypothetical protein
LTYETRIVFGRLQKGVFAGIILTLAGAQCVCAPICGSRKNQLRKNLAGFFSHDIVFAKWFD